MLKTNSFLGKLIYKWWVFHIYVNVYRRVLVDEKTWVGNPAFCGDRSEMMRRYWGNLLDVLPVEFQCLCCVNPKALFSCL